LGIHLPPDWTPVLSFLLFFSLLTMGQAFQPRYKGELAWSLFGYFGFLLAIFFFIFDDSVTMMFGFSSPLAAAFFTVISGLVLLGISIGTLIGNRRLFSVHSFVSMCLMVTFGTIITLPLFYPTKSDVVLERVVAVVALVVLPPCLLAVVPSEKAVSRRLIFLAMGLILLIALNELSKLGLDVTAPKPHA
jgi:hypothetical protein